MTSWRASTIWPVVHDERRALIDDLQELEAGKWELPSLCGGWDVHDVLAHLVDTATTTRLSFIARMVASGFDFDRDNAVGVARERRETPQATLSTFRDVLSLTSSPPAPVATRLVEAFVHGEDIRRPLGIKREYPSLPVAAALKFQLGSSIKMGGGRERAKGLQLVASDTDFVYGDGLAVQGAAIALLLAVSGRPVDAHELSGPGAASLLKR
ncbi:hypothetical protein ART_0577 [Arthrobacter sp. PAMC 25486]|uniref:maleylpyruvate isomerase family mycothiol-dependent enzyme n=1 Tax=Arthrobacter sp. PAMC 25486 TaxID=1494608 RepID=UPI000535BD6E|nr:maleylpyruvate isomerase family mycothiol-dependent enzyme [Arthrobacter sp. PAMC 25486]AIY00176.1 hypothetical protein ART_0577 [Arthrobacter sp. PAMC 25486]